MTDLKPNPEVQEAPQPSTWHAPVLLCLDNGDAELMEPGLEADLRPEELS